MSGIRGYFPLSDRARRVLARPVLYLNRLARRVWNRELPVGRDTPLKSVQSEVRFPLRTSASPAEPHDPPKPERPVPIPPGTGRSCVSGGQAARGFARLPRSRERLSEPLPNGTCAFAVESPADRSVITDPFHTVATSGVRRRSRPSNPFCRGPVARSSRSRGPIDLRRRAIGIAVLAEVAGSPVVRRRRFRLRTRPRNQVVGAPADSSSLAGSGRGDHGRRPAPR